MHTTADTDSNLGRSTRRFVPEVATTKQSLERQFAALAEAGIPDDRVYVDKKTGASVDRPAVRLPTPPRRSSTPGC